MAQHTELDKAVKALEDAGIPLDHCLRVANHPKILAVPGIGRKMLALLSEEALNREDSRVILEVLKLLKEEWEAGAGGMPGSHHDPESRDRIALRLGLCPI